jgi:hypothetical protein
MKKLLLALFLLGLTACGSNPTEKSTAPAAVVESSPTAASIVLPKKFLNKKIDGGDKLPTAQVEGKITKLPTYSVGDGNTLYIVLLDDGTDLEYWDKDEWLVLRNSEYTDKTSCFKVWDDPQTNREVALRIHVGKCKNPSKPKQAVRPFEGK